MSEQNPTPAGDPYQQQPYVQPATQPYAQPAADPYAQAYAEPYGQYPQSGYGQLPAPQPYAAYGYAPVSRPTNTMAVLALIGGIGGFTFLPVIGSIAAVILGPMARRQIRETGENGDGMAVAGTILGWVGVGAMALVLVFLVVVPLFVLTPAWVSSY